MKKVLLSLISLLFIFNISFVNAEEIEVINNEDEYQERYLFKQGLGIWEYSRQDKKGKIISSLKYQKKVLNND